VKPVSAGRMKEARWWAGGGSAPSGRGGSPPTNSHCLVSAPGHPFLLSGQLRRLCLCRHHLGSPQCLHSEAWQPALSFSTGLPPAVCKPLREFGSAVCAEEAPRQVRPTPASSTLCPLVSVRRHMHRAAPPQQRYALSDWQLSVNQKQQQRRATPLRQLVAAPSAAA
jgi:hypothetical protein